VSGALAELVLLSVTGIAFGLGAALAVGVAVRLGAARIARVEPRSRARLLTVLGIAPLVLALVGVAACVLPSVVAQLGSSYLGWPGDHCDHHDGHPHLCPSICPSTARRSVGSFFFRSQRGRSFASAESSPRFGVVRP
jgi:hypothetical protein